MTPEGRVKNKIKKALDKYTGIYIYMPVPGGYGKPTIDYLGCFHGLFFGIEAKAPGKEPTQRQWDTMEEMNEAGAPTFVIDGENGGLELLDQWLANVDKHYRSGEKGS